jgi:malate synthase
MTSPFMRAYSRPAGEDLPPRGAFAMGGMAAQIPIKNDPAANERAIAEGARRQGLREVTDGCDGTWVAHPGLVPIAKEMFDNMPKTPNQIGKQRRGRERDGCGPARLPAAGAHHRERPAQQHQHRHPVHGRLARRATAACRSST